MRQWQAPDGACHCSLDPRAIKSNIGGRQRRLTDLTQNQIARAFENTPYTISSHAISRLKDSRTAALGAETLNDIANLLNTGEVRNAGGGDVAIQLGRLEAIVDPKTKVIETIRPYRPR